MRIRQLKKAAGMILMLVLLCFTGGRVCAADNTVDLSREGSVTLTVQDGSEEGLPAGGGVLTLYQVGNITIEDYNLRYTLTDAFKECGYSLEDITVEGLARNFTDYLSENEIAGISRTIGADGKVFFTSLSAGLYLIVQTGSSEGWYDISPFLISVPMTNEDGTEWIYDIEASPKAERVPEVSTPVDLTVTKKWSDTGKNRPSSVTVQLYHNDVNVENIVLSDANNWTYTWKDLDGKYTWQVREINVPKGYTASYVISGSRVTITNTSTLIQTGQLFWPIPVLAAAGMLCIIVGWRLLKKKRSGRNA